MPEKLSCVLDRRVLRGDLMLFTQATQAHCPGEASWAVSCP